MPSIEFVQSVGGTVAFPSAPGPSSQSLAFPSAPGVGSLLIGMMGMFDSPTSTNVTANVTDTAGNTWTQYGAQVQDLASINAKWQRVFYCLSAVGGATTVTCNVTSSSWLANSFTIVEFTKPSTLIPFACWQRPEDAPSDGSVKTARTAVGFLPGPGLMVATLNSNRSDMSHGGGTFVALPDLLPTGAYGYYDYAINPQGAVAATWPRLSAGSLNGVTSLMGFLDTAGFAARPKPLAGRGASW